MVSNVPENVSHDPKISHMIWQHFQMGAYVDSIILKEHDFVWMFVIPKEY